MAKFTEMSLLVSVTTRLLYLLYIVLSKTLNQITCNMLMSTPLNALHPYDLLPLKANCLNSLSFLISTNKKWIEDYLVKFVLCFRYD